ncbi:restriction endonuclease subunit S [Micromonospora sp. WMMD714]|uniref:restriction endonuclease subunit S n=1 Tax=Micromonospora sp. WMMD714 TaxID=3016097 RepID=UPI00249C89CA|nr:restriction endonuclease subunit S [Micromonospora sp. WMMD714]WFE63374.1 restriction endonuclease subunit S [Micromonospora sp. WMMD714]
MTEWEQVSLGRVATITREAVDPGQIDPETAYVGLENILRGGTLANVKAVSESGLTSLKFRFTDRHVLFGKLRPYLAKITRPSFGGVCSTDILPIMPSADLDRGYLAHFLATPEMIELANTRATGANLPRLSPTELLKFTLPLPSVAQQRLIAEVLDQADELRAKRREALAQLDDLTRSIFLDMFGDLTDADRWPRLPLGEVIADTKLGLVRSAEQTGPQLAVPYIRMNAIDLTGKLDLHGVLKTEASRRECEEYGLQSGDLLFNTRNSRELVGKSAVYRGNGSHVFNNNIMRIRFREEAHPAYVDAALRSRHGKHELELRKAGTTSVFAIYYKALRTLPLPLPPVDLQHAFAARLDQVERTRKVNQASLAELDALFASLQDRAFRGLL